jgi:hypothetical protein
MNKLIWIEAAKSTDPAYNSELLKTKKLVVFHHSAIQKINKEFVVFGGANYGLLQVLTLRFTEPSNLLMSFVNVERSQFEELTPDLSWNAFRLKGILVPSTSFRVKDFVRTYDPLVFPYKLLWYGEQPVHTQHKLLEYYAENNTILKCVKNPIDPVKIQIKFNEDVQSLINLSDQCDKIQAEMDAKIHQVGQMVNDLKQLADVAAREEPKKKCFKECDLSHSRLETESLCVQPESPTL